MERYSPLICAPVISVFAKPVVLPLLINHALKPELACGLYTPFCKNVHYEIRNIKDDID